MGIPPVAMNPQPQSALQAFLVSHPRPERGTHSTELHNLALQVAFNLRYEHQWTGVRLHYPSSSEPSQNSGSHRPLLSGMPPRRIYMHPDEQIELLQKQKESGKGVRKGAGMDGSNTAVAMPHAPAPALEREWVLPSHLRERWTLRKFGDAFDAITAVVEDSTDPAGIASQLLFDGEDEESLEEAARNTANPWRRRLPKRLLLGTLDDDSTVVFYIVHDGIVKPRQN